MKRIITLLALVCMGAFATQAQLKTPAPSPLQKVTQAFGLGEVVLEYSRPSAKGRAIFGDVVPFDKVWRTGANGSTKITIGEDTKIEGQAVKAGTYALYSMPGKSSWTIMLYSDLTLGGNVEEYDNAKEVLRFKVNPTKLTEKVETFTVNLNNVTPTSAVLEIVWENTRVPINLSTEIDAKVMKQIESTIIKDNRPYYSAASYYYENGKDLALATEWINKALEINPKGYWMALLKAKILMKQKDMKGAIAAAELCKQLATEDKDDSYVNNANKLLDEIKKIK
jgi:hypothetical protein